MRIKQQLFRFGVLLGLSLCASWTGLAYAHGECVPEAGVEGGQPHEVQPAHPEEVVSKAEDASLRKVLTTRNPRRTDIPDYLLVIMLALIGIVVISRRDVSRGGQEVFSREQPGLEGTRGERGPL